MVRFRLSCRCSRPPRVAAPPSSSSTGAGNRPRRPRSFSFSFSFSRAGVVGPSFGDVDPSCAAGAGVLGDSFRAASFFSTWRRRCSESGLLAARLARIASCGSLMSRLLRGGLGRLRGRGRLRKGRHGRQLDRRRRLLRLLGLGRFLAVGRGPLDRRGLLRPGAPRAAPFWPPRPSGLCSPRDAPRRLVRGKPPSAATLTLSRPAPPPRPEPPAPGGRATASGSTHLGLDRRNLLVRQTSKRRALAGDADTIADVDQHFAVDLQLLG